MRSSNEIMASVDFLNNLAWALEKGKTTITPDECVALARLNGAIAKVHGDSWRNKQNKE